MNKKHRRTLERVFETPERADILWRDIESLFSALGGEVSEGRGSRVRVALGGVRAVFHRPHPREETSKGTVPRSVRHLQQGYPAWKSVRRFLQEAGVKP